MTPCTRAVLTALEISADAHAITHLSNTELMAETRYGRRSVEYAVAYLRDTGIIEVRFHPVTSKRIIKLA